MDVPIADVDERRPTAGADERLLEKAQAVSSASTPVAVLEIGMW